LIREKVWHKAFEGGHAACRFLVVDTEAKIPGPSSGIGNAPKTHVLRRMTDPLRGKAPGKHQAHAVQEIGRVRNRDKYHVRASSDVIDQSLRPDAVLENVGKYCKVKAPILGTERLGSDVAQYRLYALLTSEGNCSLRYVRSEHLAHLSLHKVAGEVAGAAPYLKHARTIGYLPGKSQVTLLQVPLFPHPPPVDVVVQIRCRIFGLPGVFEAGQKTRGYLLCQSCLHDFSRAARIFSALLPNVYFSFTSR